MVQNIFCQYMCLSILGSMCKFYTYLFCYIGSENNLYHTSLNFITSSFIVTSDTPIATT